MNEQLKEIAIKAKELGFKSRTVTTIHTEKYLLGGKNVMLNDMCFYLYLCDLQEWLRSKHNILVYLLWYDDQITEPRWSVCIHCLPNYRHSYIAGYDNYQLGLQEGIKESLKLIKV